jgi:peptidyl-prolyl cis-trans isomerase B (cyclophilin B)
MTIRLLLTLWIGLPGLTSLAQEPSEDLAEMQAVVRTTLGDLVMEFHPDEAPNHVREFVRRAREGFYDGTTFHSMVANGIVQGGDPYTRDPERVAEYGTGGFNLGLDPEFSELEFNAGRVVATLLPGDDGSGGSQFFICVADQPQFAGQFTAFGQIVEGLDIVRRISETPTDDGQIALERVEILEIGFRPVPPPPVVPFSTETVEELALYRVVMETSEGDIELEFFPADAPNHVRHFLRLVSATVYDQTAFHRIAPGFVVQAGDLNTRSEPYPQAAEEFVVPIRAEINAIPHTAGIVSMARGEAIDSALTSFFIVLDDQPDLDGVYTVFGRVLEGMDVVERISSVETDNEQPVERVDIYRMRVERMN